MQYQDDWLVNALALQSSQTVTELSAGVFKNNNPQSEVGGVVPQPLGTVSHPRSGGYSIQEQSLMSKNEYKAVQVRGTHDNRQSS